MRGVEDPGAAVEEEFSGGLSMGCRARWGVTGGIAVVDGGLGKMIYEDIQ